MFAGDLFGQGQLVFVDSVAHDADHVQALVPVFLDQSVQLGHFRFAGFTEGLPVEEDRDLAAGRHVQQFLFVPFQVLHLKADLLAGFRRRVRGVAFREREQFGVFLDLIHRVQEVFPQLRIHRLQGLLVPLRVTFRDRDIVGISVPLPDGYRIRQAVFIGEQRNHVILPGLPVREPEDDEQGGGRRHEDVVQCLLVFGQVIPVRVSAQFVIKVFDILLGPGQIGQASIEDPGFVLGFPVIVNGIDHAGQAADKVRDFERESGFRELQDIRFFLRSGAAAYPAQQAQDEQYGNDFSQSIFLLIKTDLMQAVF